MRATIPELQAAVDSAVNSHEKAEKYGALCDAITQALDFELLTSVSSAFLEFTENYPDVASSASAHLYNGMALIMQQRYQEAAEKFVFSLQIFKQIGDTTNIARTLLNIGRNYTYQHHHELALEYYTKSLDIEIENKSIHGIQRVISNIRGSFQICGKLEETIPYLQNLVLRFDATIFKPAIAIIYAQMGAISMLNLSDYQASIENYQKAAELYHESGYKAGESEALDFIGGTYWYLGEAGLSIEYALRSIAIAEEADNPRNLINRLTNAAYSYMHLEDYQKVIELNERAKALSIEHDDQHGKAWSEMGIAMALLKLGEAASALEHADSAIEILSFFKNNHGLGYAYFRRGEALMSLALYNEAYEAFNKSLTNRQAVNSELEIAETQCEIGKLLVQFEKHNEALTMLHEALDHAEKTGGKAVMYSSHKALSDVYYSLEEFQKAFYHLQKHMIIRDEVHSKESSIKAARLEHTHKQEMQQKEQEATDRILNNVLPKSITKRLKTGEKIIADTIPFVTVIFADVVGFTPLAARLSAEDLVNLLACIFKHFDNICLKHGLEKIKTIGDAYMAVAGAPDPCDDHALRCANAAFDMLGDFTIPENILQENLKNLELDFRIGIHTGSAVAGVIGESKFAYDLWGDAVNTASRMESHGEPGKIHVTEEFLKKLLMLNGEWLTEEADNFSSLTINNLPLTIIPRGEMEIKGKGIMKTYFLEKNGDV